MQKPVITIVTCCLLVFSCVSNKNRVAQTVPAFKKSPLDSAYTPIRPALQTFTINNSKPTTIKATHGTEIQIPAGCFISANGDKVENVQLEVVEAFSLPEFVTSGLATLSNGQVLISNGMAYINAKAGNENLQLKEGTALTVSMPTMNNAEGFQLFTGDGSNWTVDTTMLGTDYIMPLPLDLLYQEGNKFLYYCTIEEHQLLDSGIGNVTDKKYENTIIATEEFKQRRNALIRMMYNMSYFSNSNLYFTTFHCGDFNFNYDIWKVYFDHPTRSLRASDSIAKKMYTDYYKANKEKIAAFYDEVNKRAREYNSPGGADTSYYYFDLRNTSTEAFFLAPLQWFPQENAKQLKRINDHGVDLDSANAYEALVAKGVDAKEINEIMSYHFLRREKIRKLQREKDALVNHDKVNKLYETTVFSVKKLGWINCDRFFDDPTAGKAEMYVSNTLQNQLDFVDYSLVIPELNIRLAGYKDSTGRYTFTQNKEPYTKLPIGKNAVITAVSLQNDSLYYASQKIKITDGLLVNLSMKPINTKNLKDSLQVALNN